MPSFADIANKKANEVEKPPLPPVGKYVMQVTNEPAITKKSSDKGDFEIIDFNLQGVQHLDGVDIQELAKFGGAKGVRIRHSFIFNTSPDEEASFQRTEYYLTQFLREHLKVGKETDTLSALLGQVKGKQVIVDVGLRPGQKPDEFFPDVKSTMPVE